MKSLYRPLLEPFWSLTKKYYMKTLEVIVTIISMPGTMDLWSTTWLKEMVRQKSQRLTLRHAPLMSPARRGAFLQACDMNNKHLGNTALTQTLKGNTCTNNFIAYQIMKTLL